MPTPFQLVLGVAVLVGLGVLVLFGRRLLGAFLEYRGTRVVVCPENREMVAVTVDAGHAAFTAPQGRPDLRLEACTRWPEKAGCGQECLGQIESAPEACLLRNILGDWYQGRRCVPSSVTGPYTVRTVVAFTPCAFLTVSRTNRTGDSGHPLCAWLAMLKCHWPPRGRHVASR